MVRKTTSENFRKIRKQNNAASENFGSFPNASERTPAHTLTVLNALEIFKNAGVAVTERTIINWCHPNDKGVTRLAAWKDPNENKWFITPQSIELAVLEEQNKLKIKGQTPYSERPASPSESQHVASEDFRNGQNNFGKFPNDSETVSQEVLQKKVNQLEAEKRDLMITNKAKDYYITQLEKNQERIITSFTKELLKSRGQLAAPAPQPGGESELNIEPEMNRHDTAFDQQNFESEVANPPPQAD